MSIFFAVMHTICRWSFLTLADVDRTCLILLLVSRFLGGFSGHLWRSTYSLLYKEVHHLSPSEVRIGHINEYPTMHYSGNPRHAQSMIVYII